MIFGLCRQSRANCPNAGPTRQDPSYVHRHPGKHETPSLLEPEPHPRQDAAKPSPCSPFLSACIPRHSPGFSPLKHPLAVVFLEALHVNSSEFWAEHFRMASPAGLRLSDSPFPWRLQDLSLDQLQRSSPQTLVDGGKLPFKTTKSQEEPASPPQCYW